MHDMLVRLTRIPQSGEVIREILARHGVIIRLCRPFETHLLQRWVGRNFSSKWVSEAGCAMARIPPACCIATRSGEIVGFACYDTTARGFFGPMGVDPTLRGLGIGRALLLAALERMCAMGYAYAIIGGVGPADFYRRVVGATDIEDSAPGIYTDLLHE